MGPRGRAGAQRHPALQPPPPAAEGMLLCDPSDVRAAVAQLRDKITALQGTLRLGSGRSRSAQLPPPPMPAERRRGSPRSVVIGGVDSAWQPPLQRGRRGSVLRRPVSPPPSPPPLPLPQQGRPAPANPLLAVEAVRQRRRSPFALRRAPGNLSELLDDEDGIMLPARSSSAGAAPQEVWWLRYDTDRCGSVQQQQQPEAQPQAGDAPPLPPPAGEGLSLRGAAPPQPDAGPEAPAAPVQEEAAPAAPPTAAPPPAADSAAAAPAAAPEEEAPAAAAEQPHEDEAAPPSANGFDDTVAQQVLQSPAASPERARHRGRAAFSAGGSPQRHLSPDPRAEPLPYDTESLRAFCAVCCFRGRDPGRPSAPAFDAQAVAEALQEALRRSSAERAPKQTWWVRRVAARCLAHPTPGWAQLADFADALSSGLPQAQRRREPSHSAPVSGLRDSLAAAYARQAAASPLQPPPILLSQPPPSPSPRPPRRAVRGPPPPAGLCGEARAALVARFGSLRGAFASMTAGRPGATATPAELCRALAAGGLADPSAAADAILVELDADCSGAISLPALQRLGCPAPEGPAAAHHEDSGAAPAQPQARRRGRISPRPGDSSGRRPRPSAPDRQQARRSSAPPPPGQQRVWDSLYNSGMQQKQRLRVAAEEASRTREKAEAAEELRLRRSTFRPNKWRRSPLPSPARTMERCIELAQPRRSCSPGELSQNPQCVRARRILGITDSPHASPPPRRPGASPMRASGGSSPRPSPSRPSPQRPSATSPTRPSPKRHGGASPARPSPERPRPTSPARPRQAPAARRPLVSPPRPAGGLSSGSGPSLASPKRPPVRRLAGPPSCARLPQRLLQRQQEQQERRRRAASASGTSGSVLRLRTSSPPLRSSQRAARPAAANRAAVPRALVSKRAAAQANGGGAVGGRPPLHSRSSSSSKGWAGRRADAAVCGTVSGDPVAALFRHFDADGDGLWSEHEATRWADATGRQLTAETWRKACEELGEDAAQGLPLAAVRSVYGGDTRTPAVECAVLRIGRRPSARQSSIADSTEADAQGSAGPVAAPAADECDGAAPAALPPPQRRGSRQSTEGGSSGAPQRRGSRQSTEGGSSGAPQRRGSRQSTEGGSSGAPQRRGSRQSTAEGGSSGAPQRRGSRQSTEESSGAPQRRASRQSTEGASSAAAPPQRRGSRQSAAESAASAAAAFERRDSRPESAASAATASERRDSRRGSEAACSAAASTQARGSRRGSAADSCGGALAPPQPARPPERRSSAEGQQATEAPTLLLQQGRRSGGGAAPAPRRTAPPPPSPQRQRPAAGASVAPAARTLSPVAIARSDPEGGGAAAVTPPARRSLEQEEEEWSPLLQYDEDTPGPRRDETESPERLPSLDVSAEGGSQLGDRLIADNPWAEGEPPRWAEGEAEGEGAPAPQQPPQPTPLPVSPSALRN
eukprot:TRINITY_DN15290_c0_g2_i3.p1 TRINITY_DN15290_c0_g2~~TRINITY_DN15290_c0_g2_i3.p1  ORF type:complete len:1473 (+),score=308.78 TRINITY_DN15290_c0_g2_i3:91-4419(+)